MDAEEFGLEDLPLREGSIGAVLAVVAGTVLTTLVILVSFESFFPLSSFELYWNLHYALLLASGISASLVFVVIPIGTLIAGGYYVASKTGETSWKRVSVAVTAGYLPLSIGSHLYLYGGLIVIPIVVSGILAPMLFSGLGTMLRES